MVVSGDLDLSLRQAAITRATELRSSYDDLVPVAALREGFVFRGERISFGSFQRGIHRPRQHARARPRSTLMTAAPKPGKPRPYDDEFDPETVRSSTTTAPARRPAGQPRAPRRTRAPGPLIYFHGDRARPVHGGRARLRRPATIRPSAWSCSRWRAAGRHTARRTGVDAGRPRVCAARGQGPAAPAALPPGRAARVPAPLHDLRVARARARPGGPHRRRPLSRGDRRRRQRLALCAIHHLAYDRNLLGIDPDGVVAHRAAGARRA